MGAGGRRLVRTTVDSAIAQVHLNDPERGNALGPELSTQLAEAVELVLSTDARVLVLTADRPTFCSGGDYTAVLAGTGDPADLHVGPTALARAPIPTIAAVDGAAVGLGVNLALACDIVLASASSRFDPQFLDVGIHPGGGHLWRLSRRIGEQGAFALVICGDVLSGREAVDVGLAWQCVPDDELQDLAMLYAERITLRSPELVRRTKQTLRRSLALTYDDAATRLELEAERWSVQRPAFTEMAHRLRHRLSLVRRR